MITIELIEKLTHEAAHVHVKIMTNKQTWANSPLWRKRLSGFFSYQYAAWMALVVPIQVDMAMRDVLNEQFEEAA